MGFYATDGDEKGEVVIVSDLEEDKILFTSNANKYGTFGEINSKSFDLNEVYFRCTVCGSWVFLDDVVQDYSSLNGFFADFFGIMIPYIGFNWFEVRDGKLFVDLSGTGIDVSCCDECRLVNSFG